MSEIKDSHQKKVNELLGEEKGKKFTKMRGPGNMMISASPLGVDVEAKSGSDK